LLSFLEDNSLFFKRPAATSPPPAIARQASAKQALRHLERRRLIFSCFHAVARMSVLHHGQDFPRR